MSNFGYGFGSRPRAPVGSSPLIAFVGDSITFAGVQANTATVTANANRGASFWVPCLTKQRVRTRQDLNFGVSGNTTAQLLARIAPVAACDADYAVVHIGTNNVNGAVSAATMTDFKADMSAIWDALLNAGKVVIAVPPLARYLETAANRTMLAQMIRWVRDQQWAGRRNFYVVDPNALFADFASVFGAPISGYTYDGVHPMAQGTFYFSRPIIDLLNGLLPAQNDTVVTSVSDVYDAAHNPTGNLLSNVGFTGTGGTRTDGGAVVSGTMPTSWLSEVFVNGATVNALTIAHSASPGGSNRPWRQIALGGTYIGGWATFITFRQLLTNYADFAVGDRVVCEIEYETDATSAMQCIAALEANVSLTMGGTTSFAQDGKPNSVADQLPPPAQDGVLRTPPMLITAQPSFVSAGLNIHLHQNGSNSVTAASTVRIKGVSFRKVIA